jgi:hypothetical protein
MPDAIAKQGTPKLCASLKKFSILGLLSAQVERKMGTTWHGIQSGSGLKLIGKPMWRFAVGRVTRGEASAGRLQSAFAGSPHFGRNPLTSF